MTALWAELYGTEHLGSIKSLITSLIVIATAISPMMLGFCLDHQWSVLHIFEMLISFLMLAMLTWWLAFRRSTWIPVTGNL
jgi:MFS family permease